MKLYGTESNENIMKEVGNRIRETRISISITQEEMALRSGLSLSTVKRIENGNGIKLEALLNILRVLDLLENMDILIPEQQILPTAVFDQGHQRKRVYAARKKEFLDEWKWGDE